MWNLPLLLLFSVVLVANGQDCGCSEGECCSKWGYCGIGDAFCGEGCQGGACLSGSMRCGLNWADANDHCHRKSCTVDDECDGKFKYCFANLQACAASASQSSLASGSTSVTSLINEKDFNSALTTCGVTHTDMYQSLVNGFTAPLSGLNELALLLGHLAHESGAFMFTEEILCKGVTQATDKCPYSPYHGRGYIQLSWESNYRAAAYYWNDQRIVDTPNIVATDQTVNWKTVQYFWVTNVQPTMNSLGYTLGASTRAINGVLECDKGAINAQRIKYVQCFQQALGVPVDQNTGCPSVSAKDEDDATAEEDTSNTQQSGQASSTPVYAVALIVLGAVVIVVAVVIIVQLATILRSKVERA